LPDTFYQLITRAVADFTEHGYDSEPQLEEWLSRLRAAAQREAVPIRDAEATIRAALRGIYDRLIENGGILVRHPGVSRFTVERVKPRLRAELERRVRANANLIKINRAEAIEATLRRFSGWASSIPPGGSRAVERNPVKTAIRKELASLPFIERRVAIDQGHKFVASLSEILAVDGGALAGEWHSHFRRVGYNYREEHKERDGRIYVVRGNWALGRGLMKVGPDGYVDEITRPGEEVYCQCYYRWFHTLRNLPDEMITRRGRDELERVRRAA
jgi:hypothetical protein